ncbi:MAG: hypothetical protein HQK49_09440 [Oligoflexia bacterium]|nr:hypothetical protein [Oligoflexia bacterium]
MKSKKTNYKKVITLALFLSICYGYGVSVAQTSAEDNPSSATAASTAATANSDGVSDTIHSTALDVEGSYQSEDISKNRRDLEKENNELAYKKLEDMRIQEEKKITKTINNVFSDNKNQQATSGATEVVTPVVPVVKASEVKEAPVKVLDDTTINDATSVAAAEEKNKPTHKVKITPNVSGVVYKGKYESYQANINPGLSLEFPMTEQIGLSFGVSYSKVNITDISRNNYNWYYAWSLNNFGYNNFSKEIEGSGISIEVMPKIYLTKNSLVNPYIGAGVGYDYFNMKYNKKDQSQNYMQYYTNYGQNNYGNEEFSSSYVSGKVALGAEMIFTKNIGMNLECKYSKGFAELTKQNGEYTAPTYYNQDQRLLQTLGEDINTANKLSIGAGLVILF